MKPMWDTIDELRNQIAGYEPAITVSDFKSKQREASRISMLKLYARRRMEGLNARGQPLKQSGRVSETGLSAKQVGKLEYRRKWWRLKNPIVKRVRKIQV